MLELKFHLHSPSELSAGIREYWEEITVNVKYMEKNDMYDGFIEGMKDHLKEIFDCKEVFTEEELNKMSRTNTE